MSARLLITTQKMDASDPVLGFFCRWVEEFSGHFEHIRVVCLEEGEHALPGNVEVFSLGKERGGTRLSYALRFLRYLIAHRRDYDAVFVHMNPEYVLLGGLLWQALRKRVVLWYNHAKGGFSLRLAAFLADRVLHTSPYALPARFLNAERMPAGIDEGLFRPNGEAPRPGSILFLGRIAPVKRPDVLLAAFRELLSEREAATLSVVGDALPRDAAYYETLCRNAAPLVARGEVTFYPGVPNDKTPALYNAHEIFVNLSPSGLYDKTVLEAMACARVVVASSEAFAGVLPRECRFREGDSRDLARKLAALFELDPKAREKLGAHFREFVLKEHTLKKLAERLVLVFSGGHS